MEELKITKDNYKGYCELYKKLYNLDMDSEKKVVISMFKVFLILILLLNGIRLLKIPSLIADIYLIAICPVAAIGSYTKINKNVENKKKEDVKSNYPYVDVDINKEVLENALKKANILKNEDNQGILDIKGYENYLKAEEIKEDIYEKEKYFITDVEQIIPLEEMQKAKVKVK